MENSNKKDSLWGGRFAKTTDEHARDFQSSISFDCRLYKQDIAGSIAHARMLAKTGVISPEDASAIEGGLKEILSGIESGAVRFDVRDEDIHMNVERLLIERIGEPGKRLHTGRSRNDQVATDMRMYVREAAENIRGLIKALLITIVDIAKSNLDTYMSAYTHMQKAQPTTLAHYLMAYFEMFKRDRDRLHDCVKRVNVLPLGSGALCATTYPLDRELTARELGFDSVTDNSIDGVSDRDFCVEFLSCAALCMAHLSRFCEEIIVWSTSEFAVVKLSDEYSTGSSIMPQKKNPDMAELIRGKTGRVYGDLITMLTVLKGLPLAYNKDMQEDKECVFDAADTLSSCLTVFNGMLGTLGFDKERLRESALKGFTNATDLADYLVRKGMAFREAHAVSGRMVLYCEERGIALADLSLSKLKSFSGLIDEDVYDAISLETCVKARRVYGGPSHESVEAHILKAVNYLAK